MVYKVLFITVIAILVTREAQIAVAAPTPVTATVATALTVIPPAATAASEFNFQITNRKAWQAAPSRKVTPINVGPVPYVIIHHTSSPRACHSTAACKNAVRSIQRNHQSDRGWDDIGYNFLIGGGEGSQAAEIYEGRGFGVSGAHAVDYNSKSVGICLIGDWSDALPPTQMLEKLQQLITHGIKSGYIQPDYKLLGHRQVRATACPGAKLFNELKQWQHFSQRVS